VRTHFVLRCGGCGAPAADCVRLCPYCGKATGFPGLGSEGVTKRDDGTVVVGAGAHVKLGGGEARECPFCGAATGAKDRFCGHCSAKVVVERSRVARLEIVGGRLTIGGGGKLEVVGRKKQPIHEAAAAGDLPKVKARVESGSDPDFPDAEGRRPLHYAAAAGELEVCRWLISVGAEPDAKDDAGRTPRDRATDAAVVDLLTMVGG